MSLLVVDASVGIKWFVPEVQAADAVKCRDPGNELHVPTLFDVELANILWKKVRRSELTRQEADQILAQMPLLPVVRHADLPLLPSAFDLADRTQRTVYDSLYLALAVHLGARVVTADQRWVNSLEATQWAAQILGVGDLS